MNIFASSQGILAKHRIKSLLQELIAKRVSLVYGSYRLGINITVAPAVTVIGRITDPEGKPVSGARIEATSYSVQNPVNSIAHSAKDGQFEALGVPEGNYRLTCSATGFTDGKNNMVKAGATRLGVSAGLKIIRAKDAAAAGSSNY